MLGPRVSRCVTANPQLLRIPLHFRQSTSPTKTLRNVVQSRISVRHSYTRKIQNQFGTSRFREAYEKHPFLIPFGCFAVAMSFASLGYIMYIYLVDILIPYQTFPEPVAKELRKAIYFDKGLGKDPKKALQHYVEALTVAREVGMEGFSKEYIGMTLRVADFMERMGAYDQASQLLENVQRNCYRWIGEAGDQHFQDGHRTRIYKMAIQVGVKLGQIYGNEDFDMPEEAQAALSKAVEHLLREQHRRDNEGVLEGEGDWLNDEEVGAALEELGNSYISTRQPELALPLFLQALSLCPQRSCHSAMLMNSISASLSTQNPQIAAAFSQSPSGSKTPLPTVADLRVQAQTWATKALEVARSISTPERTEECDQACAVTTFNLGQLAEMSGDLPGARSLFLEARKLSKEMDFEDGLRQASEALARVQAVKEP